MKQTLRTKLLTEQLRPKTFKDMLLLDRVRKSLGKEGDIPQNLLFHSVSPGMGKTTATRIIEKYFPTLYINLSKDRGIEVVRNQIDEFVSTKSLSLDKDNSIKIVRLEEMDNATDALYKALRAVMEDFSDTTRFIGNCNYINKIPKPLLSRFNVINFEPINQEEDVELKKLIQTRVQKVSNKIGIDFTDDETLTVFIEKHFPDIRKTFSVLQDIKDSGITHVTLDNLKDVTYSYKELYDLIISKDKDVSKSIYKSIISAYSNKGDDLFSNLINEFPYWILEKEDDKLTQRLRAAIVAIAEWDFKRKSLIDVNAGSIACLNHLNMIFNN